MFIDRVDGGRQLAEQLHHLRGTPDVVVVGLPRGGVPVAAEVAAALDAPLDVIVVRKLGLPFQPEVAMGAIGEGGMDYESVALFAAELLMSRYPEALALRYKLAELPVSATDLIDQIGRKRGCLVAGGHVDLFRASELLLRELRAGLIGSVSFEVPGEDVVEEGGSER